ncbi:MAG: type VI secretion system contractile sheath large subunit [Gemmatimonadota bacterium]|nr:type VI secretion system contractile sheath large subunit [Gemmatimonadota bacterium]
MSRDRQQYRVELDTGVGAATQELPYEEWSADDVPFRIGLLGDFSGRANRGVVETGRALAARRPLRVDRDNVDEIIARLAPELHLSLGDGRTAVKFAELDDFHPDRLHERLPAFRALRETRARAAAPVPLGEIGRQGGRASTGRAAPSSRNLLDQILGDVPPPPGGAAAVPPQAEPRASQSDPLTDFVRRAVAPHVVPETAPAQPERVEEVDQIVGTHLRAVLHQPDFQALESAWRALDFLVRRLETDSTLQIYLIDVSKAELAADLGSADGAPSGAHRVLVESSVGTAGGTPWALLVGLYSFGPASDDVDLLRRLAAIAHDAGAPMIAAAESRVVGSPSFGSAPDPDDWTDEEMPEWEALRRSADARYVGLAAPRFLLRLPYGGPDGEPCDVPGFEELSAPAAHEEYLWGNSAVLSALLHGEAFASDGWSLRPRLDVRGLPFHLVRADGQVTAKPCAEAILSARAVDRMLECGVMAVQSMKDGDAVRLARMQSIAHPLAALALRNGSADADR